MKIDPGLQLLDQQGGGGAALVVGPQFEPLPVPCQPLHEQTAIRMPVNPGDVSLLKGQIQPANEVVPPTDQPELDPGVVGAGEGIAVLLDLQPGFCLVHDRVGRDV